MPSEIATVVFGILASFSWGTGDFCGGLATRRTNVYGVLVVSYAVGIVLMGLAALAVGESVPPITDTLLSFGFGAIGVLSLSSLYHALSIGRMGIVAPITAVLSAGIPAIFGMITEGLPTEIQLIGIVFAVVGVWFISRPEAGIGRDPGLLPALIAGTGFGCGFIVLSQLSGTSDFFSLMTARVTSFTLMSMIALFRYRNLSFLPPRNLIPFLLLSGTLDTGGNLFFLSATQAGRLDIASVLSSFYPAFTALLAMLFLKERFNRIQLVGVGAALIAIPLLSL